METLVGLLLAASPLLLTVALLVGAERRARARQAEIARQIALTDALHGRLGALVAPFVRRRRGHWDVSVALPAERPDLAAAVLTTVDEVFGHAAYELRLRRQASPLPAAPQPAARVAQESLSWT